MSGWDCKHGRRGTDLVGSRIGWLVWGLPAAFFVVGVPWEGARAWLWIPSLAIGGSACVVNASRCGRLHCYVNGPAFLLAALATWLMAAGVVAIDWRWILGAVVAGVGSGYGLEWLRGKYAGAGFERSGT